MTATANNIAKSRTNTNTSVDTRAEVASGAIISVNVAGAIIGLWAFASLVSGMVAGGGPVSLAKAWFGAVAGL